MNTVSRRHLRLLVVCFTVVCALRAQTVAAKTTVVVDGGDCPAIQAAIDSLPAKRGGSVVVRMGTYMCAGPIVIARDKVQLVGDGPETLLRLADGANSPVVVVGQTAAEPSVIVKRVRIADLTIDGNRQNQSSETWTVVPEIRNNGIALRRVKNIVVERVVVQGAASGGLVAERESRGIVVRHFAAFDNRFDGIAGYRTVKSKFINLYLHNNLAAGLSFDLDFDSNLVQHALITDSGSVGIFMRNANRNNFKDVAVVDSGDHGIFLAENSDVPGSQPATENVFRALVVVDSAGAGFRVNDASCVGNKIVDAQLADNAGGCVSEIVPELVMTSDVFCH